MKEKIRAGDYIRTTNGTIAQIEDVEFDLTYHLISSELLYRYWIDIDDCRLEIIKKHSSNIIDLIEEGDYVNGQEVIEIRKQNNKIYLMTDYMPPKYIKEDIKSIATHEQIKSIEYKI